MRLRCLVCDKKITMQIRKGTDFCSTRCEDEWNDETF